MNASLSGRTKPPSAELAVVSHGLPDTEGRSPTGFQIILDELLTPLPEARVVYVGMGRDRHASIRFPWPRIPGGKAESMAAAMTTLASAPLAARLLTARYPRVRRILALVDPTLPIAVRWAEASGAELWIYAIDLHATTFWSAPAVFTPLLERSCQRAWARADRAFALSAGLAAWLERQGVGCPIEVLPPLTDVGDALPLPAPSSGPIRLLYTGSVYSANERPLRWLERAVAESGRDVELHLVSSLPRDYLAKRLDLARWHVSSATREGVKDAVARATWTVIALDPSPAVDWRLSLAWPTKLREYLAVGRPVLCIAGRDYDVTKLAEAGGWGIVATDEAETVAAVRRAKDEPREALERFARAAHAFALREMDNRTIGESFRARALAPSTRPSTPKASPQLRAKR